MSPDDIRAAFATLRPPPQDPAPLRAELSDALLEARRHRELAADWRMAEAALQHPDALRLWKEALAQLRASVGRQRDCAYVHEQLAELCLSGGDEIRGREHLGAALAIARRTDADDRRRLSARLGAALLSAGLPHEAEPVLVEAIAAAARTQETLVELGLASVLSALRLSAGDLEAARGYGARVVVLGARRGNWIAVADGLITQSACHQQQGAWRAALEGIVYGSRPLQAVGALAALNLLQAHLTETRKMMGEESFDEEFGSVVERLADE
ncbi:MAG: hypothetical protein ACI8S6_002132 [Myxococcota bacterium]|jgi:hypothetical protein